MESLWLCRHVHAECDEAIDNVLDRAKNEEQVDYMCSVCRNRDPEVSHLLTVLPWLLKSYIVIWLCPLTSTNYSKFKLELDLPFF